MLSLTGILLIYVEPNFAIKDNPHGINHFARAQEEFGFDPLNGGAVENFIWCTECIHTRNNNKQRAMVAWSLPNMRGLAC